MNPGKRYEDAAKAFGLADPITVNRFARMHDVGVFALRTLLKNAGVATVEIGGAAWVDRVRAEDAFSEACTRRKPRRSSAVPTVPAAGGGSAQEILERLDGLYARLDKFCESVAECMGKMATVLDELGIGEERKQDPAADGERAEA